MREIQLIISFEDDYQVCRVTEAGKNPRTWVSTQTKSDKLTFGDGTKEKVKAFAKAISTDDWVEYMGRRARSERPELGDPFYQFLNHKLTLIYEDDGHLIYQAQRKPRRKSPCKTQPEQPEV